MSDQFGDTNVLMARAIFYRYVQTYVESDPESAAHIMDHVQSALSSVLKRSNERSADMEAALATVLKTPKTGRAFAIEKLTKWEGPTALRWDWFLHPEDK